MSSGTACATTPASTRRTAADRRLAAGWGRPHRLCSESPPPSPAGADNDGANAHLHDHRTGLCRGSLAVEPIAIRSSRAIAISLSHRQRGRATVSLIRVPRRKDPDRSAWRRYHYFPPPERRRTCDQPGQPRHPRGSVRLRQCRRGLLE